MRKAGNVSIKNLVNNAETTTTTNPDGTTTTTTTINIPSVVNDVGDVETVIQTMISNDKILDENDVQTIVSTNLANYTTTSDLQNDYATKTLLTNTLDNYTSKDLLTQSLSDRPTFTTTDAITTTTTNHENRIKGLEDNFVSTTVFTEALGTKAASTHTHTINDITDYTATDLTSVEEDVNELTEQILAIEESLDDKANSTHTHILSDISDYVAPDLSPYATTSAMNTALSDKAATNHTHELDDVILTYEEEEETNGETSTITKTKTLPQILNNCTKLDTANTFTARQTINADEYGLTINIAKRYENYARLMCLFAPNLTLYNNATILIGRDGTTPNYHAELTFCYNKEEGDTSTSRNKVMLGFGPLYSFTMNSEGEADITRYATLGPNLKENILSLVYPVGSIYMNRTNNDNPSNILGFGTWTQITGYFLYPAPNNENIGDTGGSWWHNHTTGDHTLTIEEMPSHNHGIYARGVNDGASPNENLGKYPIRIYQDKNSNWDVSDIYIENTGGNSNGTTQPHNHGNTGDSMAVPPFVKIRAWYRTA